MGSVHVAAIGCMAVMPSNGEMVHIVAAAEMAFMWRYWFSQTESLSAAGPIFWTAVMPE